MTKRIISITMIMVMVISLFTLTGCNNKTGQFYTIEEAYESGIIDMETVKHIFYYAGIPMKKHKKDYYGIEFKPKMRKPFNYLSERFEKELKQAYYIQNKEYYDRVYDRQFENMYDDWDESVYELYELFEIDKYYGRFEDVYAMVIGEKTAMVEKWRNMGEIYYYLEYQILIYKNN